MYFKHKKVFKIDETKNDKVDSPLIFPLIEIEQDNIVFSFKNGITVTIIPGLPGAAVTILTPTHNITQRFASKFTTNCINTPEELLELLNIVAKLPNVYTINKIPDSCFNF